MNTPNHDPQRPSGECLGNAGGQTPLISSPEPSDQINPRFAPQIIAPTVDEIDEPPVKWLWQDRIPLGAVTLLVAEPNAGKSYLTIALAAHLSRGDVLPGNADAFEPCSTLLFEMEDRKATVKERAMLCRSVGDKIRVSNSVQRSPGESNPFSLADIGLLEEHLRTNSDTKLIVINPLAAIMDAGTNDYRELDVRQVISRLELVAREFDVAIVAVRHFGKRGPEQSRRGIERVLGSIGLVAAARSVLGIDCDGDSRHVISLKNNLGKRPAAVSFRISDDGLIFEGEDPTYQSADEASSPESRLESCVGWLRNELSNGPMSSKTLESRALTAGFSKKTYQRAKERNDFHTFQRQIDGRTCWLTQLLADANDTNLGQNAPDHPNLAA